MTKKDIINKIKKDFKGMATTLINGRNTCVYLTDDGRKCAIGLFIPEKHEAIHCDYSVKQLLHTYPELRSVMPSKNIHFLHEFQRAHDSLNTELSLNEQKQVLIDYINKSYDKYNHNEVKCG